MINLGAIIFDILADSFRASVVQNSQEFIKRTTLVAAPVRYEKITVIKKKEKN